MEQMIPLTIDGVHVEVPAGTTVLEAARIAKVNIPCLLYTSWSFLRERPARAAAWAARSPLKLPMWRAGRSGR